VLLAPLELLVVAWSVPVVILLIAAPIGLTIAALRAVPFGTHSHIAARL
jgi:hypothetical protein